MHALSFLLIAYLVTLTRPRKAQPWCLILGPPPFSGLAGLDISQRRRFQCPGMMLESATCRLT